MLFEKRNKIRFFCIHLCIIIPIAMASFFVYGMITDKTRNLQWEEAIEQLDDSLTDFVSEFQNYYNQSILLAYREELLTENISVGALEAEEGIKLLKLKKYFDNSVEDVFVYYGEDYIYSTKGMSRKSVHFESVLGCMEESVQRGLVAVEKGQSTFCFLFTSDTSGYLMYSYPMRPVEDGYSTVSFLISFEQLKKQYSQIPEGQFYQLEASDGSRVMLGKDENGEITIISEEKWSEYCRKGKYLVQEEPLEKIGLTARLFYQNRLFNMDEEMYQMQAINLILLVAGIIISVCASWVLSKRRVDEILRLEQIARGNAEQLLPEKSAYTRLLSIMTMKQSEAKALAQQVKEREAMIKEKTANMILHGLVNNTEDVQSAFGELGLKCPENYFLGVVSTQTPFGEFVPDILKNCLMTQVYDKSRNMVVFLYELSECSSVVRRKIISEDIRTQLHRNGIRKVRIGMSQIYTDILKIDCAYSEAMSVLEYVLSGKADAFYDYWEHSMRSMSFVMSEVSSLQQWADSLQKQDFDSANEWFGRMLQEHRKSDGQEESQFIQSVMNTLKQCMVKEEADNFTKMLEYIDENYGRSDLSYEEVAEAGGVSKTYVSKIFRTKLGMSYIEYVTSVRLEKACILLQTAEININDIVKLVGYENASSFRRNFKAKFGMSPAEYRQKENELETTATE